MASATTYRTASKLAGTTEYQVCRPSSHPGPAPGWPRCRVNAVLTKHPLSVLYDSRATAEDNWHEVTGVARGSDGRLVAAQAAAVGWSPYSDVALRYASFVAMPDGSAHVYYEMARADGAHNLCTNLIRKG